MTYQIEQTDKAADQLRDMIYYIADDSNVETALKYLDKIESGVKKLADFPLSGNVPRYSVLRKQGYRVLIIDRHLVFYKVKEAEKMAVIYAIVDGRREYRNLL